MKKGDLIAILFSKLRGKVKLVEIEQCGLALKGKWSIWTVRVTMITCCFRMAPLDHVKFHQKRLVETAELVAAGSESGVLQNNHILLENQVNRICAPKDGNEKETRCIILWTKESVDDHTPSPEKIVCLPSGTIFFRLYNKNFFFLVWCYHLWSPNFITAILL